MGATQIGKGGADTQLHSKGGKDDQLHSNGQAYQITGEGCNPWMSSTIVRM